MRDGEAEAYTSMARSDGGGRNLLRADSGAESRTAAVGLPNPCDHRRLSGGVASQADAAEALTYLAEGQTELIKRQDVSVYASCAAQLGTFLSEPQALHATNYSKKTYQEFWTVVDFAPVNSIKSIYFL